MSKRIEDLLHLYKDKLNVILGQHIKKVILYGSYARGDFNSDSDIDVMILVDAEDIRECENKIIDITYDFNMKYDTDIMPVVQNMTHFEHWKTTYMFYNNISKEGMTI